MNIGQRPVWGCFSSVFAYNSTQKRETSCVMNFKKYIGMSSKYVGVDLQQQMLFLCAAKKEGQKVKRPDERMKKCEREEGNDDVTWR